MIRFIDVYKEYDNGTKALKGIDLRIDDGEFVFLVGPSGSGKSTIIKLITGEIALTQGKLMVNGYSLNNISPRQVPLMRRTLGIIFQDFRLIDHMTVYDNVAFAMRVVGASARSIRKRVPYILSLVGLQHKAKHYPTELSGGERQKAYLAMVIAQDTDLIFLDEPTTYLDIGKQFEILELIRRLNREGKTIVMVLHDLAHALTYSHRIAVMEKGCLLAVQQPEELFKSGLLNDVFGVEGHWAAEEKTYYFTPHHK